MITPWTTRVKESLTQEELTIRLAARPVSVVLFSADGREWSGPLPAPLELVIPVVENQTEDDVSPELFCGVV